MTRALNLSFLGDYPPRQCGIATFTRDLRNAIVTLRPDARGAVLAVTDPECTYDYPPEVRFEIPAADLQAYGCAADFLHFSSTDILCTQHEFGLFRGPAGSHVIHLLRRTRCPVVTTLHTILTHPADDQRRVFEQLIDCSNRLVCMSHHGHRILREVYKVPTEKIAVIPHGIPDLPFRESERCKDHLDLAGRNVLLTFGLLSPGKGIEHAITALPAIVARHPQVVYVILGATHPNLIRDHGETYRHSLEQLASHHGVTDHVRFINRYVGNDELCRYISAADIYLTPYLNEAQITSGALAYCFGAGKAVISTPYWHAAELLTDGRGILVPFRDAAAIARAANDLLDDPTRRLAMGEQAYLQGRQMIWPQVAQSYLRVCQEARDGTAVMTRRSRPAASHRKHQTALPAWQLDHLDRMTDSTGVFQHARFHLPSFEHGYCTDDNARALLFTALLEDLDEHTPATTRIQITAAAFLQHAWNPSVARFHNFMSFDRRWLDEVGSEDCHGRALWALGTIVARTRQPNLRAWAAERLESALPATESFTSPRAWAFTILGLHEYLDALDGDLLARRKCLALSQRLFALHEAHATPEWPWLEPIVSYDNARLPQALILTGVREHHPTMLEHGLATLRWLSQQQTGINGCFRPIGSDGHWPQHGDKAAFDQQPVEASAAVSACLTAHAATGDPFWQQDALRAFGWFLGRNDLNQPLYDATTGGTCDGLHSNRVNQNQGAESTLAFLLALAGVKSHCHRLAPIHR